MGNREDLMRAARASIVEKGFDATSARDLATAAGTSLAAIGYHFGGKDALLAEALLELIGEGLGDALTAAVERHGSGGPEAFAALWSEITTEFERQRPALIAGLENLLRSQRHDDLRERLVAGQREAIREISDTWARSSGADDETARAVGALYYTLLNGLVLLWLADGEGLPSGSDLAAGLWAVASR